MTATVSQPARTSPILRRIALLACGLACGLSGIAAVSHHPASARTTGPASTVAAASASTFIWSTSESGFPMAAIIRSVSPATSSEVSDTLTVTDAVQASHRQASEDQADLMKDLITGPSATPLTAPTGPSMSDDQIDLEPAPRYRVMMMEVTAYCPCTKCCGDNAQGITASGKRVTHNAGRFVAADTRILPFNTQLSIPGYHGGQPVPVLDRGGAIKGNKLDVYFDSHETAKQWGRRMIPVRVLVNE